MRHRVSRLLLVCIVLSVVVHFTAGPFFVWLFGRNATAAGPQEVIYVARSSALRLSKLIRPAPPRKAVQPSRVEPQPVQPQQQMQNSAQPHAQTQRREIARIDVKAQRPQVTPLPSPGTELTQDEDLYRRTIAQLRDQNNPVVSAARAEAQPQTMKNYTFNVAGEVAPGPHAQGILQPLPGSPWHQGGYNYYYVRYWVEYADGTVEHGIVPWPLRYLPSADPFRRGEWHIPLPKPLPDYQLPLGTTLQPLLAYCFEHRDRLDSCPIQHD